MSKIICDVCGTSYPDTATQCPICGCVRTPENKKISEDSNTTAGYTYVKGGRFSKSNVRKRMKTGNSASVNVTKNAKKPAQKAEKNGERGLVVAVIVLLLAIIAAVLYITFRFFLPAYISPEQPQTVTTQPTETEPVEISCEKISLDATTIAFSNVGDTATLTAEVTPADTTDTLEFVSADETVAKISYDGNKATVTAVAEGKTMVVVTCGTLKVTCNVECVVEEATDATDVTDPSDTTTATVPDGAKLEMNREDITLLTWNESWDLYTGDIPAELISWTTDNAQVATIDNGVVKAVGVGMTTVYGEYNGQKVSCIIRCSF